MPTLTGVTSEEFQGAVLAWRKSPTEASNLVVLAALGAVRECWAQDAEASAILGLTEGQLQELLQVLAEGVDDAA
jgi:hypothetical protein